MRPPLLALIALGFLLSLQSGWAAPGDLDPSFGVNGKTTTFIPNLGSGDPRAYPRQIALQPDGRIIVGGKASSNYTDDFVLVRYNVNGSIDTSFGGTGIVRTDFFGGTDELGGIAIQPDGKIVAGGSAVIQFINNSADSAFALVRYNPDGSLDNTFGTGGKVVTNFRNSLDEGRALLLQPDGKIVLAGFVTQGANTGSTYDFAVVRYNPDGSLDGTFGANGIATTDFAGDGDRAYAAVLQPDGKIVLAGVAFTPAGGSDFALARLNADGSLDSGFNGSGKVTTPFASNFTEFAWALALAPDNKLVAAGWAVNNTVFTGRADYAVARYNQNGSLDPSFNGTGRWTDDIGGVNDSEYARAVTVQPNGKIVVAGSSQEFRIPGYTHTDFAVLRLNPNGTYDSTWGNGGKVYTDFGEFYPPGPSGDSAEAILLLPDGRLLVAGTATPERYRFDFAIARYAGDPTAATMTKAVSRRSHTGDTFDLALPANGTGIESRESGGEHQIVFSFSGPVTVNGATVDGGGSVSGYTTSGSDVVVDLTGVANGRRITVSLSGVNNGSASTSASITFGVLVGDTNGDGVVSAADTLQTRNRSGQLTDGTNFRFDVNRDGAINSSDTLMVRSRSGSSVASVTAAQDK
jgi:uncharacterized delta-60 repeat protein